MAYKPPKPLSEYFIGKYDNNITNTLYLICKEVRKTWYNHRADVKHYTIQEGTVYTLRGNAQYTAYEFYSMPNDWHDTFKKYNRSLYDQFVNEVCPSMKEAVKSEPTPDQCYLVYNITSKNWSAVLRKPWDEVKRCKAGEFIIWDSKSSGAMGLVCCEGHEKHWSKPQKFPQLSSEVKAELQKLNPERYKEWEDFYMKKYPNMQPLDNRPQCGCGVCKSCLGKRPLPDPKDGYITVSYGELCLVRKVNYTTSKPIPVYSYNWGWVIKTIISTSNSYDSQEVISNAWRSCDGIKPIYEKFQQYYSELEQKRVVEKQYPKIGEYYEIPMEDFEILSYSDPFLVLKSDLAKLGPTENCITIDLQTLIPNWCSPYLSDPYSYKPSQKFLYVHETWYKLPRIHSEMIKVWDSKQGSEDWTQRIRRYPKATFNKPQISSNLDIDQQALGEAYHNSVQAIIDREGPKLKGEWNVYNLPESVYDPKNLELGLKTHYLAGIDPYQSSTETQGVITIWSRDLNGKLVNRLIELEKQSWVKSSAEYYWTPKEYYDMIMNSPTEVQGVAWLKPRTVGRTQNNDLIMAAQLAAYSQYQQTYSPNLKQQNDEIINLPRKTITITSGQEYSRSIISSYRCAPAITAEHTKYGQEPCRGKENTGGCKIS